MPPPAERQVANENRDAESNQYELLEPFPTLDPEGGRPPSDDRGRGRDEASIRRHEETQGGRPADVPEPGARAFAWGIWFVSVLAASAFVAAFGTKIPVWDDYNIIPTLVRAQPLTMEWLWEPCNEHRIALPKLILLGADRLAGDDVRAGMALSVAALAALAAAMIVLAGRLPGGPRSSDALFPLLVLSLGQAANLLWSIQFAFILPTVLATLTLVPMLARPSWPGPGKAWAVGVGMTLLPLCGGTGLVFVPAFALWLLGAAAAETRSAHSGRWIRAIAIVMAIAPALALTVLYFKDLHRGVNPEVPNAALNIARTALQFLVGGLGMSTASAWPWSGLVVLGLIAAAVIFLLRAWVKRPEERPRIFGLLAFLAGLSALAAAVGVGRGWAGDRAGFQPRYVTMATPFWCWLAFTFRLYAPPATSRLMPNVLLAVACLLAWPNTEAALERGREGVAQASALSRDLAAGMPAYRVIRKYTPYLCPAQDVVAVYLPMLRAAGFGPFQSLRESPSFRTTTLPPTPSHISMARWEGNTALVTGIDPQLTYELAKPRHLAGIRIKYGHSNLQKAPARFVINWRGPGQYDDSPDRRYANWNFPTGEGKETIIWIDDTVSEFRIQPDNQPGAFRIDEIALLED